MCCCYSVFVFFHRVPQYFWRKQSSRTGQYIVIMSATSFTCISNCMCVYMCAHGVRVSCMCVHVVCTCASCEYVRERNIWLHLFWQKCSAPDSEYFLVATDIHFKEKKRFMCYSLKLIAFWKACRCMSVCFCCCCLASWVRACFCCCCFFDHLICIVNVFQCIWTKKKKCSSHFCVYSRKKSWRWKPMWQLCWRIWVE